MSQVSDREKAENLIQSIKEKSDDDYEKNVTYISAGTLILSLTFLEKIIKLENSSSAGFLVTSWILMGLTLGLNLLSHQLSSIYSERSYDKLARAKDKVGPIEFKIRKRNKIIRNLNWVVTASMFLGMSFLIVFCSINALNPKVTPKERYDMSENRKVNTDSLEKKGRTVTVHSSLQSVPKEIGKTSTDSSSPKQSNSSNQSDTK